MNSLKKKHQDAVAEMSEQIDQLSKMKAKIEKDKGGIFQELTGLQLMRLEGLRLQSKSQIRTLISNCLR